MLERAVTNVNGAPVEGATVGGVVLAYSDAASEYLALRRKAVVIDRSQRGRMRLSGPKAAEVLTGLVTNDVMSLQPGQGQYAAALTAKGRVVADLRLFAQADAFFLDAPPRAWAGWLAVVQKFVNPRLAVHRDESATIRDIGIFGATARHVVAGVTGVAAPALVALPDYGHLAVELGGSTVIVARVPDLASGSAAGAGIEGFELLVSSEGFSDIWDRAVRCGAVPAGLGAWDIARVEAGRPEWGLDMDEQTIAQEANLDMLGAVSYTKGCYVGQEVVARVHFRGHVNRHLRGLRMTGAEPAPAGARLFDTAGAEVGEVRSTVMSPRFGPIGLAMVRREVANDSRLSARWGGVGGGEGDGLETPATVAPLPFPD